MQDELSKHLKKIYDGVKDKKHTFREKVIEVAVEIGIIVFAVTLSIWLHTWSEHAQEQKEAREFLIGLKGDLIKDIKLLEENKKTISYVDSNFKIVTTYKRGHVPADTEISHHLYFSIPVTHPNIGRYDGFKSSGKIGTIENDDLKENILVFYQQSIPDLSYNENFVNSVQLKMLDLEIDRNEKLLLKDFVTSGPTQSRLQIAVHNLDISLRLYNSSLTLARKIVSEIDKETKE